MAPDRLHEISLDAKMWLTGVRILALSADLLDQLVQKRRVAYTFDFSKGAADLGIVTDFIVHVSRISSSNEISSPHGRRHSYSWRKHPRASVGSFHDYLSC